MLLLVAVVAGIWIIGKFVPGGFIPDEDQGIFGVTVQLPAGASLERTSLVLKKIEDILAKTDGLDSYQTVGGYGAVTSTFQSNYGTIFVRMKPWDERKTAALHVNGIMGGLRPQFAAIPEAVIFAFNILFWMFYEQAGNSFTFLADQLVDRVFGDFVFPTAWFQSIPGFQNMSRRWYAPVALKSAGSAYGNICCMAGI